MDVDNEPVWTEQNTVPFEALQREFFFDEAVMHQLVDTGWIRLRLYVDDALDYCCAVPAQDAVNISRWLRQGRQGKGPFSDPEAAVIV